MPTALPAVAARLLAALIGVLVMLPATAAADAAPATPEPGGPPDGIVRHAAGPGRADTALDYWTPQRMSAAEPLVRLLTSATSALPLPLLPRSAPGDGDRRPQRGEAPTAAGEPWTGGGAVAEAVGRVFLTMDGRDFTCSAALLRTREAAVAISAGHCMTDGRGGWSRNWVFVPGYEDGRSPHGRYAARELLVTEQWASGPDDDYDFGLAVLHPDSSGRPVTEAVNGLDAAFDTAPGGEAHAFGYPAAGRFDGERLHHCAGRTRADDRGTSAMGMECGMTQGSSGGPFLSGFDPATGAGAVSSVISFKYSDDSTRQYGPRLGAEARRLLDYAESR